MLRQFHSIYDPIVFQSTKLYKKRQKTGYNGPNPLFLLIKSRIKPQLTFSLFCYDLSTFDPCFLLLSIAYTLGAMFGEVCPSDVCSIRIIRPSSFQIVTFYLCIYLINVVSNGGMQSMRAYY